jgi:hypothetical protein
MDSKNITNWGCRLRVVKASGGSGHDAGGRFVQGFSVGGNRFAGSGRSGGMEQDTGKEVVFSHRVIPFPNCSRCEDRPKTALLARRGEADKGAGHLKME